MLKTLLLISQFLIAQTDAVPNSNQLMMSWEPRELINGSPCLFLVRPAESLRTLSGRWQGRRVFFDFDAGTRTWYGLAGVGIDTASGSHQLALEATLTSGARISSSHPVTIGRGNYRTIDLRVPRKYTEPDPETLVRINQEREFKNAVFSRISEDRLWRGRFVAPLDNVITEVFGVQRTLNGVRQSVHQGLDFRADIGTPVCVMNSGTVIIAREMFFEGKFVVIDHGQGLTTLYMHLSEIKVNEGERVKPGQVIGLSGATGRVTAQHLHIGVRWQGVYLNPATLLSLNFQLNN